MIRAGTVLQVGLLFSRLGALWRTFRFVGRRAGDEIAATFRRATGLPAPAASLSLVALPRPGAIGLRMQIALAMVLLALFGAITAYRGALAEMESSLLEQKLGQGRLLELFARQDRTDGALAREVLFTRRQDYERIATELMRQADAARGVGQNEKATWLDLQAQVELAASRALRQVLWMLPSFSGAGSIEQSLRRNAVLFLHELGFDDATWSGSSVTDSNDPADAAVPDSIWPGLEAAVHESHHRSPLLAFGVLGFILSMALLTFADLSHEQRRKRTLFRCGCGLGILALLFSVTTDAAILIWYLTAAVTFAAFGAVAWWLGLIQGPEVADHHFHPAEVEAKGSVGRYPASGAVHGMLAKSAVAWITVAVVFSSLVGAWFSTADSRARAAALDAVGYENVLLKRGSLFGALRSMLTEDIAQYLERRARLAFTSAQTTLLPPDDPRGAAALEGARVRKGAYDQQAAALADDPEAGLQADPGFPLHKIAELALHVDKEKPENGLDRNPWEAFANWDAARAEGVEAHERAVVYLATLTVFAVAIFLLSQAHGVSGGRASYVLLVIGVTFVVIGAGIALRAKYKEALEVHEVHETAMDDGCRLDPKDWGPVLGGPNALAARHFGIAMARLGAANSPGDYGNTIEHLKCTISIRPHFAEAHRRLASALFQVQSSQIHDTYQTLPGPDELDDTIRALTQAVHELKRIGLGTSRVRASLAFDSALAALRDRDSTQLNSSVDAARLALLELPVTNEAMLSSRLLRQANLATILLARGDRVEALAAYQSAFLLQTPLQNEFLYSLITDLQTIYALKCGKAMETPACKTLDEDKRQLTADIVGRITTTDKFPIAAGDVRMTATRVNLTADLQAAPEAKASGVVLLWYARDPRWNAWRVLPDPSGPLHSLNTRLVAGGRRLAVQLALPEIGRSCNATGQYRLEVFIDGKLAGEAAAQIAALSLEPVRFPELNVVGCVPATWKRLRRPETESTSAARQIGPLAEAMVQAGPAPNIALYLRTLPGPRATRELAKDVDIAIAELQALEPIMPRRSVAPIVDHAACVKAASQNILLARAWRTREGTAYVALAPPVAEDPEDRCDALLGLGAYYAPIETPPQ